jgi:flagellar motor protein MotB
MAMSDASHASAEDRQAQELKAFKDATDKAADAVRNIAKWVVGGVAALAGGVIAGASLTSMGALSWGWRLQLAAGALAAGLCLLGYLMWFALEVITPHSYSMVGIAKGKDIKRRRLKTIEEKVKGIFPEGIRTTQGFTETGMRLGREAEKPGASSEVVQKAEEYRNKRELVRTSIIYENQLLLFSELRLRVFVIAPLIAFCFGVFAWAANPPKDSGKNVDNTAAESLQRGSELTSQEHTSKGSGKNADNTAADSQQTDQKGSGLTAKEHISTLIDETNFAALGTGAAFLLAGISLLLSTTSKLARSIGVALVATAPFVSGLTFLKIEKPRIKVERLFDYIAGKKYEENHRPPIIPITLVNGGKPAISQPFTAILTSPPFPSGSAVPDERLSCFLQRLATELASTSSVNSITIEATADRRELRPDTRRQYGSNWALAQQRGICVSRVMLEHSFPREKIFVTNAGPLHTSGPIIDADLESDRSVSVFVSGNGERPEWLNGLKTDEEGVICSPEAVELRKLCI